MTIKDFILEWEALENSGEEETAIVEIAEDTFENEAIYNLQGIKVINATTALEGEENIPLVVGGVNDNALDKVQNIQDEIYLGQWQLKLPKFFREKIFPKLQLFCVFRHRLIGHIFLQV